MALEQATTIKLSPPPVKDRITSNDLPTIPLVRYLEQLSSNNNNIYSEFNKIINQVNQNIEDIENLQEKQVFITSDTDLEEITQIVFADCTDGEVNIKLPKPTNMIIDNISNSVSISKIDTSSNKAIILPYDSELIVNEASQELVLNGEILNFITDGTNWYLKA